MENAVKEDYVADTDHLLKNPERGMYFGSRPNTPAEFHTIVFRWLWLRPWCAKDLVWNGYHPDNQNQTSPVLNEYAKTLEDARSGGYKILFRPRYDRTDQENKPDGTVDPDFDPDDVYGPSDCTFEGGSDKVFHADSLKRQRDHITAIANMLADYRDVIAFIQAGYLGRWGEWNWDPDSGYTSDNAPLLADIAFRAEIIDHILFAYAAAGIAQDVELRRPVFAKEVVERWKKPENSDIYQGASPNVGLHNDCFMTTNSDFGTYSNFDVCDPSTDPDCPNFATSSKAKEWAQSFTENASFGGEACPAGGNERWRTCSNMTGPSSEPASLHMNYLNGGWPEEAVTAWSTPPSCYDDIHRNLGYRFEVTSVEYPETVAASQNYQVNIHVRNVGWAKLHKPRDAKLVLRNGATKPEPHDFDVGGDVETWGPGETKLSITTQAPSTPGKYSVRLWIPDPDLLDFLSNAPNPEDYKDAKTNYAVKLATLRDDGKNVFDPDTAENDLGVEIEVQ